MFSMKIAQVVQRFPFGGAESYVEEISNRLTKDGYDVTVITSQNNDINDDSFEFKIIRLKSVFSLGEYSFWKGFDSILQNEKFDLIHSHTYGYFHSDYLARMKKKFNYKLVMTSHGFHGTELHLLKKKKIIKKTSAFDFLRPFYDSKIGKKTILAADHLIALSKKDVEFYKNLGVDTSKISIIPPGIKQFFFDTPSIDLEKICNELDAEPILLTVGELSWVKAKSLAVKAMPLILKKKPKAKLFLIGKDRDQITSLKNLVKDLDLENNVFFLGFKTENELSSYLHAADILIHTSLAEGLSTVLLESMASGLPFITTPAGGNGILAEESGSGIIIPFEDKEALSNAVVNLDAQKLEIMSQKGKKFSQNLSWDKIYERIVQVYSNLLR